jgi:hypothetical protein
MYRRGKIVMIYNSRNKRLHIRLLFCLIIFLDASILLADDVTLSWNPPTANADGTPLTDLDGYIVYVGTQSGNYSQNIDVGNVTTYQVNNLTTGLTYYFAATAYDTSDNESDYSSEVSKTIQSSDTTPVDYYCDNDGDGYIDSSLDGSCTGTGCEPSGCQTTPGNDCNDNNSSINPGANDFDCNGVDDNCDGTPDNNYVTEIVSCGTGVCTSIGQITCQSGTEINTCTPGTPDEYTESTCDDGLDNDCDGQTDEGCSPNIKVSKVLLSEDFFEGVPTSWLEEGVWSTDNPCGRTIDYPFVEPSAVVDSSCRTTGVDELTTSSFDASSCDSVELFFSNQYYRNAGNIDVDISSNGGATWVNNINITSDDGYPTPNWKDIDISNVAGTGNAQIKFRYSNDTEDGFWAIDNIWVTCQSPQLEFISGTRVRLTLVWMEMMVVPVKPY